MVVQSLFNLIPGGGCIKTYLKLIMISENIEQSH